jgi:hypothetical protein
MTSAPQILTTEIYDEGQTFWGSSLQPAGCPACRQAFLIPTDMMGAPCPTCARGLLSSQPTVLLPHPPLSFWRHSR